MSGAPHLPQLNNLHKKEFCLADWYFYRQLFSCEGRGGERTDEEQPLNKSQSFLILGFQKRDTKERRWKWQERYRDSLHAANNMENADSHFSVRRWKADDLLSALDECTFFKAFTCQIFAKIRWWLVLLYLCDYSDIQSSLGRNPCSRRYRNEIWGIYL